MKDGAGARGSFANTPFISLWLVRHQAAVDLAQVDQIERVFCSGEAETGPDADSQSGADGDAAI